MVYQDLSTDKISIAIKPNNRSQRLDNASILESVRKTKTGFSNLYKKLIVSLKDYEVLSYGGINDPVRGYIAKLKKRFSDYFVKLPSHTVSC